MGKPQSEQIKGEVVNSYLKGSSYREVSSAIGVSIGTVSNVIGEAKSKYPDLEQLRELRSKLPQDVDIPALNKAVATVLEAERQLGINIQAVPEYIEAKKKAIVEQSEQKASLSKEVSELLSKRDTLQSEVKESLDKKAQLGEDIKEYEDARKQLADYRIDIKNIHRLRNLLDKIISHGLNAEKCVQVVEHHQDVKDSIADMKAQLDELVRWRDLLQWSMGSLEHQHTEKGLQLNLKIKAVEKRDTEIQELDRCIRQLKGEVEKLEARKQFIIAETSREREKRERMLEAYGVERDRLKGEVEALKAQVSELEKAIAEKHNIITIRR